MCIVIGCSENTWLLFKVLIQAGLCFPEAPDLFSAADIPNRAWLPASVIPAGLDYFHSRCSKVVHPMALLGLFKYSSVLATRSCCWTIYWGHVLEHRWFRSLVLTLGSLSWLSPGDLLNTRYPCCTLDNYLRLSRGRRQVAVFKEKFPRWFQCAIKIHNYFRSIST